MAGDTRRAAHAQPEWLRQVPTGRRLPDGARVVFTGCGTSFHAAQTGGRAVQALEAVLDPPEADLMVCVSHEGETALTLEAARAFGCPVWLVTGRAEGPLADLAEEVVVCTPEVERSWCHTASYTCAVAAIAESVRAYVLEGEGRAAERAHDAVRALETVGCETTLLPTRHPVVDIVFFHLLTLALADARGVDPDAIRREPGSAWAAAAGSAYPHTS